MSDLISREAVYMANEHLKPCSPKDVEDMISCIPSVQQWIPCSERLPKAKYGESKNVLASCESGYIRLLYFDGGNWCYPTGEVYENSFDFVIAWMPLPEPYREDGEE